MRSAPIHIGPIMMLSLIMSIIFLPMGTVFANPSYSEKVEIIALEAKDGRDFIDPHRVCDVCGMTAQRFFLSGTIRNNSSEPQPFVTIMEIRDQDGITQYLQFQLGNLDSNETSNVGISWDPTRTGEFELTSFVISDFNNPEALSRVHSAAVRVS